jgi:hypothetical protein
MKTYWRNSHRGFGNEYTIAVATSATWADAYCVKGYERIDRKQALRDMVYRGDNATQAFVFVEVDGGEVQCRLELARSLRAGGDLVRVQ